MLKSLKIKNFRCFKEYELQQLGRINLLVGMNNNGKTAILEAIYLLYSQDDLSKLAEIMINRDEIVWNYKEERESELEVKHLFYEHEIEEKKEFMIVGNQNTSQSLKFLCKVELVNNIVERLENKQKELQTGTQSSDNNQENQEIEILLKLFDYYKNQSLIHQYGIHIQYLSKLSIKQRAAFPLLKNLNLLVYFVLDKPDKKMMLKNMKRTTFFLPASTLSNETTIKLFEQILLTPEEDLVIEALQIIEPTIKRIAVIDDRFFILLSDNDQRIPIGNMGDGIQRILGLALALVNSKDGILLVDEIDTGLHFMTLSKMWKLVWETANKLNVQVFATTHNSDCWTSLTELIDPENSREDGITLHRIEKDKPHSILLTEDEIAIAAERGIEVR